MHGQPRLIALNRHHDINGVSGTGVVAYGIEFPTGLVMLWWLGDTSSTVIWTNLDHAMRVHGHNGATELVQLTPPYPADLIATLPAAVSALTAAHQQATTWATALTEVPGASA